jgi:hypothetical protein
MDAHLNGQRDSVALGAVPFADYGAVLSRSEAPHSPRPPPMDRVVSLQRLVI